MGPFLGLSTLWFVTRAVCTRVSLLLILIAWARIFWLEVVSCRWSQEDLRGVIALDMLTEEFLTGQQDARGWILGFQLLKEAAFSQVAGLPW